MKNPLLTVYLLIILGAIAVGAVHGLVWSFLAPGSKYKVFTDGTFAMLPTESLNRFTDFAIFALLGLAVGVVGAAALWHLRPYRGYPMLVVVTASAALASVQAGLVGQWAASGTAPSSIGPSKTESIVTAPPVLTGWPMLLAGPAAAVLVYTFLVAWNGLPELGRPAEAESLPVR
ncbi:DUF2567 domain-containing protein [Nakamurella antarctica]|uniref:DUF2567 domain-containing protein n=1 Tax=Nakamurella antarctica TaxID=1902245 RepID=A0A3G8ZTK7_9ACTN|nr:DUF2567 domain-containing protein [Nakamurella antarctica]AZI57804.1 DUF2567 domain-containing protein [Nakamurella antarctica]